MPTSPPPSADKPLLEIGWILAGHLDKIDRAAIEEARVRVQAFFTEHFPDFQFVMPIEHRDELVTSLREEAIILLDYAVAQRNIRRWDYTLILTGADLISHYKTDSLAAISRTLESAVISTVRIDPQAMREDLDWDTRCERMAHRITTLALHSLCHLMGLDHYDGDPNLMNDFSSIDDLDRQAGLTSEQIERVRREVHGTADHRLEETGSLPPRFIRFYAEAAWLNRHEILDAIVEARPWQFPFRLSRLTAAAVSAMVVLLVTAEAWELGTSQDGLTVGILSFMAVVLTTVYIVFRQQLLVHRGRSRLSEQNVVTNLATFSIVLTGMLSTYVLLFISTLALGFVFFDSQVVSHWSNRADSHTLSSYLLLSGFVSSLCIFIGSLGASFEQNQYFRHITFVDEEV